MNRSIVACARWASLTALAALFALGCTGTLLEPNQEGNAGAGGNPEGNSADGGVRPPGYGRDVDLVMREHDLQEFKRRWLGRGYAERQPGTGKLIDTELGVHIDVLSTGRFPGDDKPKPIAFPDPATTAIRGAPFALLPVERWIELKLASGIVAAHRPKDLADVQELIREAKLERTIADHLHPWVRDKFLELWDAVDAGQRDDPY